MPKKVAPFAVFVRQYMKKHGISSFDEAKNLCDPIWSNMSEEERQPFKQIAKGSKPTKSLNIPLNPAVSPETMAANDPEYLANYKSDLLREYFDDCTDVDSLVAKPVYIVSFNVLCKDNYDNYIPNEIGLVKYSIKGGIHDTYHAFMTCCDVPFGCANAAKEQTEIHRIPYFGFSKSIGVRAPEGTPIEEYRKSEMEKIVLRIMEFVKDGQMKETRDNPVPKVLLFAMPDQIEQVDGCVKFLSSLTQLPYFASRVEILDIVELHFSLYSKSGRMRPKPICQYDLQRFEYDFSDNVCCDFHEDVGVPHCAIGKCRRLAYMLSDVLLEAFGCERLPSHSCQPKEVEFKRFVGPKNPEDSDDGKGTSSGWNVAGSRSTASNAAPRGIGRGKRANTSN